MYKEDAYKEEKLIMFIIDKDHIDNGESNNSLHGEADEKFKHLLTEHFRLYDDDGELYYEGRCTSQMTEAAFAPLDWAMANAGCTDLQYLNKGKWESM